MSPIDGTHCVLGKSVPVHEHGTKFFYDHGCKHVECKAAAAEAKRRLRKTRYGERIKICGKLVHPGLMPVDSVEAKRHGTSYGRTEFGCHCDPCRTSTPRRRKLLAGVMIASPQVKHPPWWHAVVSHWAVDVTIAVIMLVVFTALTHWGVVTRSVEFTAAVVFTAIAVALHQPPGRHRVIA